MADKFWLVVVLTDFTIAQMRALKIYSRSEEAYPNRAFDLNKTQSTMILGEGAGVCLENGKKKMHWLYRRYRYATEVLEHNISISAEATCFQNR
jgi:hypothetical protein